jgi:hypothetical protein
MLQCIIVTGIRAIVEKRTAIALQLPGEGKGRGGGGADSGRAGRPTLRRRTDLTGEARRNEAKGKRNEKLRFGRVAS